MLPVAWLFQLKSDLGSRQRDYIARVEYCLVNRLSVNGGAVGAFQVYEPPAIISEPELGVVSGYTRVIYDDIVIQVAAQADGGVGEGDASLVNKQMASGL